VFDDILTQLRTIFDLIAVCVCVFQDILTQLRTIFDLIINFQSIQETMYHAAKDELLARQNYEQAKMKNTDKVIQLFFIFRL